MSQTVTISKTEFERLTERIKKLEAYVFGKKQARSAIKQYKAEKAKGTLKRMKIPDEILTPRQDAILQKKYEKVKREIAEGKGYVAHSAEEMMKQLRS